MTEHKDYVIITQRGRWLYHLSYFNPGVLFGVQYPEDLGGAWGLKRALKKADRILDERRFREKVQ